MVSGITGVGDDANAVRGSPCSTEIISDLSPLSLPISSTFISDKSVYEVCFAGKYEYVSVHEKSMELNGHRFECKEFS